MAQLILNRFNDEDTLVLDLGAGTCVIDQMLIDGGFSETQGVWKKMKTTKELLKQNGWKEGAYDDDVDEQYYWKENVCTLVAIHNSVDDVKIDTSIFEPEYVEPDFLRKILEEVEKIEVK